MGLHSGAVPGDEEVPDGRMERWMEVTLMRGRRRVCQCGISNGQKEGCNRGGFLYSDRRSTAEGSSKVPAEVVGSGVGGVAVTAQRDEDQEGGGRRWMGGGRTSPNT